MATEHIELASQLETNLVAAAALSGRDGQLVRSCRRPVTTTTTSATATTPSPRHVQNTYIHS